MNFIITSHVENDWTPLHAHWEAIIIALFLHDTIHFGNTSQQYFERFIYSTHSVNHIHKTIDI